MTGISTTTDTDRLLAFALDLDRLKSVERRTSPSGLVRRENSAEHSWHAALCAVLFERECCFTVDSRHAALLLLMHDVPEIECGDTFAYATQRDDASAHEAVALATILGPLPAATAQSLAALWCEFTENETNEARYANALDRLLPVLHNVSHGGKLWRENGVTLEQVEARNGFIAQVLPSVWARTWPCVVACFEGSEN